MTSASRPGESSTEAGHAQTSSRASTGFHPATGASVAQEPVKSRYPPDPPAPVAPRPALGRVCLRLIGERAEGVGYLLKDRVADVEDFLDAVRRVAKGGSVIDPEVISNLVGRPRKASPLDQLTLREREALTTASDSGFVERLWGERREAS